MLALLTVLAWCLLPVALAALLRWRLCP